MHLRPDAPPSTRSERDETAGFTVTEMLVAMMLLTIGALALYQSMTSSNVLAENAERHSTATRLAASEIEKARTLPYDAVAMNVASAGTTYFEGAQQVTDAVDGRVIPSTAVVVDGITFDIRRYVTWRSATVNGGNVSQAFKQLTVIVSWTDTQGTHDVRSASAVSRTTAP